MRELINEPLGVIDVPNEKGESINKNAGLAKKTEDLPKRLRLLMEKWCGTGS